jgi:hypothetical protein
MIGDGDRRYLYGSLTVCVCVILSCREKTLYLSTWKIFNICGGRDSGEFGIIDFIARRLLFSSNFEQNCKNPHQQLFHSNQQSTRTTVVYLSYY